MTSSGPSNQNYVQTTIRKDMHDVEHNITSLPIPNLQSRILNYPGITVAITADSCPTQSWGMWALSYAKYEPNTYIKTDLPWGWVCCAINILLAYLILM